MGANDLNKTIQEHVDEMIESLVTAINKTEELSKENRKNKMLLRDIFIITDKMDPWIDFVVIPDEVVEKIIDEIVQEEIYAKRKKAKKKHVVFADQLLNGVSHDKVKVKVAPYFLCKPRLR